VLRRGRRCEELIRRQFNCEEGKVSGGEIGGKREQYF
jgi:hypothetical protein